METVFAKAERALGAVRGALQKIFQADGTYIETDT